jgi:hypothetical protein
VRPTRYYSNKQEKDIANKFDGNVQINSGAFVLYKGDVKTKHFLIEAKTTIEDKKSFSIKKEWLEKISKEAFSLKRIPVLAFRFEQAGNDYYIIDERTMKRLKMLIEDLDNE